jgi:peptide subunit release factor 1 (eRF1)
MISRAEVDKLLSTHAASPAVLSVYVHVPLDPAALRGLQTRVGELVTEAERARAARTGGARRGLKPDREAVRELLEKSARDWLGHTVAMFSCAEANLIEGIALPGSLPARALQERAVLAPRPYVRPLLSAIQRSPTYFVAVVDRRNAWVFKVSGERIETIAQPVGEGVRSSGFGGWYGLEAYRVHERVIQLARHHYRETAAILERAIRADERGPLVVGGREKSIAQFLGVLPGALRDRIAGSFVADPHTMTAARVRELSGPAISHHVEARERRIVNELLEVPPGGLAVTGLRASVRAVNQRAAALLIVGDDMLVPGFACGRCGRLATAAGTCPDCGDELAPVPDLIEEMVIKTTEDGGRVEAVADPPEGIAARLRFPVTETQVPGDQA